MNLIKDRLFCLLLIACLSLLVLNFIQFNYITSCELILKNNIPTVNKNKTSLGLAERNISLKTEEKKIDLFKQKVKFKSVLDTLPHTAENSNYDPDLEISKSRNASLVIGISTVKREITYLFDTLNSIFSAIEYDKDLSDQVLIILSIAEVSK